MERSEQLEAIGKQFNAFVEVSCKHMRDMVNKIVPEDDPIVKACFLAELTLMFVEILNDWGELSYPDFTKAELGDALMEAWSQKHAH